jgi:hypothetical protein
MNQYAICNEKGEFYTKNGWRNPWASKLEKAKIYKKEGTAKAQITSLTLANKLDEIPKLVILETLVSKIIPQTERVQKAINDKRNRETQYKAKLLAKEIDCKTSELLKLKQQLKG